MERFRQLISRVSIVRLFVLVVVWGYGAFLVVPQFIGQFDILPDNAQYQNLVERPFITQLAHAPWSLHGVDSPDRSPERALRIAWVAASPMLYGNLSKPDDPEEPAGFIGVPVAEELTRRLGRPVEIEAYVMPSSRLVEKYLVIAKALATRPDAVVLSLSIWDHANRSISMPHFDNFRIGAIAGNPSTLLSSLHLWRYLHASEIAWASLNLVFPVFDFRFEMKSIINKILTPINPVLAGKISQETYLDSLRTKDPILQFTPYQSDLGIRPQRTVGSEGVLRDLLWMVKGYGIPALAYVDPTMGLLLPQTVSLEAALKRFVESEQQPSTLLVDPESLSRFLTDIEMRDTNHLKRPATSMTRYLANRLETVIRRGQQSSVSAGQ